MTRTLRDDGSADPDDQLRLLLLVAHERDREPFAEQLADGYEVVTATPDDEWPPFDLCLDFGLFRCHGSFPLD
ncbi:hypothetical protein BRC89_00865 [Halobacteriales archaeon QS_4_70_19]|nr:MAG: hypothetical protein BRC89_00865 [Halobacteriales archaeon QS_4_70_19]